MTARLRENTARLLAGLCDHYSRHGWIWLLAVLGVVVFTHHYRFAYNYTTSLPQTLFLIRLGDRNVVPGDYIAFESPPRATGGLEMPFVKQVACMPGETVTSRGLEVFCGERKVAQAKAFSLRGEPLETVRSRTLADDEYFVTGTHRDSFDSRYEKFGPVQRCRFIGRAIPVF